MDKGPGSLLETQDIKEKARKSRLNANVVAIRNLVATRPFNQGNYGRYSVTVKKPFAKTPRSMLYKAVHQEFKDRVLIVKVYEGEHGIDPNESMYLKIISILGKKHPNIIETWDIFHNPENNEIRIYQELANRGSIDKYLEQNQCDEKQAGDWACHICKGVDYLVNIGISHRGLQPKNMLLTDQLVVKLTGFENAAIYWDPVKEDIKNIACLPQRSRTTDLRSYQAPEVYGDPSKEEFDPIVADVWSIGATVYFMLTKKYPIVGEINWEKNSLPEVPISDPGRILIGRMLNENVNMRIGFNRLITESWVID